MAESTSTLSVEERASQLYQGECLAPMVRASSTPLRTLALRYGADLCYTEEFIDRSLQDTVRVENTALGTIDYLKNRSNISERQNRIEGGPRTLLLLRIDPKLERGKLVCQIGTGEPELAVAAALHVHQDVAAIDVNMGCPKKFSVSGGMGSALLSDPQRACQIIRKLTDAVSSNTTGIVAPIPVSAKIRLLKDVQSTVDFITALVSAGAKAVAIHGRTVGVPEQNPADWETLESVVTLVKSKFPNVPILINGDFYTRDEFTSFRKRTGASGVLLARPALYNASIFRKPTEPEGSYGYQSPLLLDKTCVIQEYLKEAIKYDAHYKNVKYVTCEMMNNRRAPHARVPFLSQRLPKGLTIGTTCACSSLKEICELWNVDYNRELKMRGETLFTPEAGEHTYLDSYIMNATSQTIEKVGNSSDIPSTVKDQDTGYAPKRVKVGL